MAQTRDEGIREHERIRNKMRVCDERKEDGCLWAEWEGSSRRDIEDEGPHFKIKGWIKVLADVSPSVHANTQLLFLSLRIGVCEMK